jgi:hypothetical protein
MVRQSKEDRAIYHKRYNEINFIKHNSKNYCNICLVDVSCKSWKRHLVCKKHLAKLGQLQVCRQIQVPIESKVSSITATKVEQECLDFSKILDEVVIDECSYTELDTDIDLELMFKADAFFSDPTIFTGST